MYESCADIQKLKLLSYSLLICNWQRLCFGVIKIVSVGKLICVFIIGDIIMKKLLLGMLIATSCSVFADECHDVYFSRDFARALELCKQKAEDATIKDNWEAPFILGNMYDKGYGVVSNINNAAYWYEMAGKRGNCTAFVNLWALYKNDCDRGSYSCQQSKVQYWGHVMGQRCPVDPQNPNFSSNQSRYYSLVSQNRSWDFLPGTYK